MCCAHSGYWCRLWLAYMHAVLLGIDLLRMHNNKPYFKDSKHAAGFLKILNAEDPQQTASSSKIARQLLKQQPAPLATTPHDQQLLERASTVASATEAMANIEADAAEAAEAAATFSELHDLSDGDTYALAALIATLLLQNRMADEHVALVAEVCVKPATGGVTNVCLWTWTGSTCVGCLSVLLFFLLTFCCVLHLTLWC